MVVDITARTLGYRSSATFDPNATFKRLGVSSLTAVEVRNEIQSEIGIRLPSTAVYDHPSPVELSQHIESLIGKQAHDTPAATAQSTTSATEPLAIVGISCRFPGGANSPDSLWQLVEDEVDAVGEFPVNRGWDRSRIYDPTGSTERTSYVDKGAFLYDADCFDASFFGISPREAVAMDPQQRVLLEQVWAALEHGGIDPHALRGTDTGVFVGCIAQEYGSLAEGSEVHTLTGTMSSIVSGRISYTLGLRGPAITIDTGCSASLVSLHLAHNAISRGECSMALVGGVTIMPSPGGFIAMSQQRGLSRDGRCRAFAGSAD
ncbi:beta-ketoacyl synthase N-terminal-like domain-containing protein, partial [Streptomyces sp. NPDC127133]